MVSKKKLDSQYLQQRFKGKSPQSGGGF